MRTSHRVISSGGYNSIEAPTLLDQKVNLVTKKSSLAYLCDREAVRGGAKKNSILSLFETYISNLEWKAGHIGMVHMPCQVNSIGGPPLL